MKIKVLAAMAALCCVPFLAQAHGVKLINDTSDFDNVQYGSKEYDNMYEYDSNTKEYKLRNVLTDTMVAIFHDAALQKVRDFNDKVNEIWQPAVNIYTFEQKKQWSEMKEKLKKHALQLFIADGESYTDADTIGYTVYTSSTPWKYRDIRGVWHMVTDRSLVRRDSKGTSRIYCYEQGVRHEPASIETTSLNRRFSKKQPVKRYLSNIIIKQSGGSPSYDAVNVTSGGYVVANKLVKSASGDYYEGFISYYQDFEGHRPEGGTYKDRTHRTVRFIVYRDLCPTGDLIWRVKLGDVQATATERLY